MPIDPIEKVEQTDPKNACNYVKPFKNGSYEFH
jgi:hypothetical protein